MNAKGSGVRGQGSGWAPPVPGPGNRNPWSRFAGPALVLLAAAVAVAPQLRYGNTCGHDFDFHLVSWFDCLNSWRHGLFYPHWASSANFGAGEPRFVFYPPLTWMLGAALGLALPWPLVPVALTFLLLAATGLATRALALEALPEGAATLAGCAALLSGYALFTAYERSAFGELAGGFWLPLVLLLALRDRNRSNPLRKETDAASGGSAVRRALDGSAAPLALVVAGAWLSNAPVGVMACYLLAAVALAAALLRGSWAPLLRAAAAAAVGMGLAAFYLVPAAWEQGWVDIRQATDDPGLLIENSFLFARHADPQLALHDFELARVSWIAVAMVALALGGFLLAWRRSRLPGDRRWWLTLALIPLAVLFLQLPLSLPVWHLLPKLRFLQFPWRWLVALEAPMAVLLAAGVWSMLPARRGLRAAAVAGCAAALVAASLAAGFTFFQSCDEEDAVAGMASVYRDGGGFAGVDEYAPPGADNSLVPTGLPVACLVADPTVKLGEVDVEGANPDWWVEQGSCAATFAALGNQPERLRITANIPRPGFLVLRLRNYPAWRVTLNGRAVSGFPEREDGLMAVPVPQGPIDLAAVWTPTPDLLAGRGLAALALLLLTALCLLERKLARPRLS